MKVILVCFFVGLTFTQQPQISEKTVNNTDMTGWIDDEDSLLHLNGDKIFDYNDHILKGNFSVQQIEQSK